MSKAEQQAFNYGLMAKQSGIRNAPCFDLNMHRLVKETRTEKGSQYNLKIMDAWNKGYNSK
jgi:hypothetical protein